MILKSVYLENIRSYKKQKIEFNKGSTLLAGDIGSGKTSVLLGIEFGLFGLQPGQKGSSLLKLDEENAKIILEFEVSNKNVIVERTLKRGKSVSQENCSIEINGIKEELSVTELKSKILELLHYPREFSKKQNLLYKFTVYTPQEEMKQIILQDPETRINTIRHIFGIDKYKKVLDNISIIRTNLREQKKLLEGQTSNLDEDLTLLEKKKEDLKILEKNLKPLESEFENKKKIRKKIEKEKEDVEKKIEEKRNLNQEKEKSKIMILSKRDNLSSNQKDLDILKNEISEFEKLKFDNLKITQIEEDILSLKKKKEKLSDKILETNSQIISYNNRVEENNKLALKFSNLEKCPTCLQEVDSIYRANILNKNHNEISQIKEKISGLESNKKQFLEESKKLNLDIEFKEKELSELKILKMKLESIKEKKEKFDKLEKSIQNLNRDLEFLNKHISDLNDSILSYAKYEKIYEEKQKELEISFQEEKKAEIKFETTKREIDFFKSSLLELENRIIKTQKLISKLNYLSELESWVSKKFITMISFIESNVLKALKHEFSKIFSGWFSILVGDSLSVRLTDNFTPVIEQQDYELDYAYLSGGERTAVALAYRLALNQVINSLISELNTKDLVILDEPTDGFSSSQLDKMRTVLEQLNVAQLIIVSHEQKIEGFVENVIRLKKENGESFIEE